MKGDAERRVYVLPYKLFERITEFTKSGGYASEVDAARKLLEVGLNAFETKEDFQARIAPMSMTDAILEAIGHPLVSGVTFSPFSITFTDGESFFRDGGSDAQR